MYRSGATNTIDFYDSLGNNGSIQGNDHAFYFRPPGYYAANIVMYGNSYGTSSLRNTTVITAQNASLANMFYVQPDQIFRSGAASTTNNVNEIRNIMLTSTTTDFTGTSTSGVDDGTIRLQYTA